MGGGQSNDMFVYRNGKPFNGIVEFLTREGQGNPHDTGKMQVTASSTGVRCLSKPEEVLAPRVDGEWSSNNEAGSWITFKFCAYAVELHNYSIQTFSGKTGTTHLKSWKLEASNDGYSWTTLDNVPETPALNGPDFVVTRPVPKSGFYKIFRITMTGPNHFGTNCLTIKRVEFCGQLVLRD